MAKKAGATGAQLALARQAGAASAMARFAKSAPKPLIKTRVVEKIIKAPPTHKQIAGGALSTLALAVPIGILGSFGLSAIDGALSADAATENAKPENAGKEPKKPFAPPVIGWRGTAGIVLIGGGALMRSPLTVAIGGILLGSCIPQVTRSLGEVTGSPALLSAGEQVGQFGALAAVRAAQRVRQLMQQAAPAWPQAPASPEEVEEEEIAGQIVGATRAAVRQELAGSSSAQADGQ